MRTTIPMDWAELKRSRFHDRCRGYAFWTVGLAVLLIGLLKVFYEAGSTNDLFSPMFFPLGNFAVAVITPVWWIPGISLLWQLDYFYVLLLGLGLCSIGAIFIQRDKKKSQTMRNADQQAQEERLRQERLGYQQGTNSQGISINVSGGTIHGHVIGDISGANTEVNYTYNDLDDIRGLVSDMHTHREELNLDSSQRMQFESRLQAIQGQLIAMTPNHSLLHDLLLSLRHIVEAGAAHMLVGHWRDILHTLQRLATP